MSQWVVIDHEKFERLVNLLQYFTQRLNDFCPIEPKLSEQRERDDIKTSSELEAEQSRTIQIGAETTQEPHDETGTPLKLPVEETNAKASPMPVQHNTEAEILEEPGVVERSMAHPGYETCSTYSAAHLEHPKKSLSWSVDDIVNWRSNG
jgi:hypothetical protein